MTKAFVTYTLNSSAAASASTLIRAARIFANLLHIRTFSPISLFSNPMKTEAENI